MDRNEKTGRFVASKTAGMTPEEKKVYRAAQNRAWIEKNWDKYVAYQREYSKKNSKKKVAAVREWRKTHKRTDHAWSQRGFERHRWYQLKCKFGIIKDDYYRMLDDQGGVCAMCKKPPPEGKYFHVDHDHETNEVRGLLHGNCNRALGFMKEDPEACRAMTAYAEECRRRRAAFIGPI